MNIIYRSTAAAALSLCLGAPLALAQGTAITEQEAHNIGVDAYIYLYSLVTMDISRKQFTNIEPGKEFGKGPMFGFWNWAGGHGTPNGPKQILVMGQAGAETMHSSFEKGGYDEAGLKVAEK